MHSQIVWPRADSFRRELNKTFVWPTPSIFANRVPIVYKCEVFFAEKRYIYSTCFVPSSASDLAFWLRTIGLLFKRAADSGQWRRITRCNQHFAVGTQRVLIMYNVLINSIPVLISVFYDLYWEINIRFSKLFELLDAFSRLFPLPSGLISLISSLKYWPTIVVLIVCQTFRQRRFYRESLCKTWFNVALITKSNHDL